MTTPVALASGLTLHVAGSPDATKAVIVLQEAFGVTDHIHDVAERFAQHGYYAVAPELFHRDGGIIAPYDDFSIALAALATLTREGLESDLRESAGFLNEAAFAPASIGVVGYCMGGTVATFADTLGLVGAAASFYGGGVLHPRFGLDPMVEMAEHLQAPWIGLYGDLDKGIPPEQVEQLREKLLTGHVPFELHRYPDADHGFHCDDRPAVFSPADAADAAERTYRFFDEHLVARR